LGDEHPFTSYYDVHQGYKVLTHCHFTSIHIHFATVRCASRYALRNWTKVYFSSTRLGVFQETGRWAQKTAEGFGDCKIERIIYIIIYIYT
jgi:hypothetical protein